MRAKDRVKEISFTKDTYISAGYPPAIKTNSGNFKGAKVVNAIGGSVTLCFLPHDEQLDTIGVYLLVADAHALGKLLIERAGLASQELLSLSLEGR